jgi:hypothetical protein
MSGPHKEKRAAVAARLAELQGKPRSDHQKR